MDPPPALPWRDRIRCLHAARSLSSGETIYISAHNATCTTPPITHARQCVLHSFTSTQHQGITSSSARAFPATILRTMAQLPREPAMRYIPAINLKHIVTCPSQCSPPPPHTNIAACRCCRCILLLMLLLMILLMSLIVLPDLRYAALFS